MGENGTVKNHINGKHFSGIDFIGDVHGCMDELEDLLTALGHHVLPYDKNGEEPILVAPAHGRKIVFSGDLVDRGPRNVDVLRLAMGAVGQGHAMVAMGNHDHKMMRALMGNKVNVSHGLGLTLNKLKGKSDSFNKSVIAFVKSLPLAVQVEVADRHGNPVEVLCVHAAMPAEDQDAIIAAPYLENNGNKQECSLLALAIYGVTNGNTDSRGLPERVDWAQDYTGHRLVVHGHTPIEKARLLNRVACIDTGCAFGGSLTAFRMDRFDINDTSSFDGSLVRVPARRKYSPGGMRPPVSV